jgi:nucleoside-diphosphate-sugar epimerase
MRILVTGGGGFLGSHLVDRLESGVTTSSLPRQASYDHACGGHRAHVRGVQSGRVFHLAAGVGGIGANLANPDATGTRT